MEIPDVVTEDAADKARAEAEARRQRILAKSKERLVTVGDPDADQNATKETVETATTTTNEPSSGGGVSSAARMRAMRRRRFNKAKKEEKTTTTTEGEEEPKQQQQTEGDNKDDSKAADDDKTTATATTTTTPKEDSEETKKPVPTTTNTDTTEKAAAEATTPTKKKYKGVAKMRREMLQKKKLQQEKEEKETLAAQQQQQQQTRDLKTSAATSTTKSISSSSSPPVMVKKKVSKKLPIYLHLFTIVLLLLAGLDVGLLIGEAGKDDLLIIDTDVTPRKLMGKGIQEQVTDSALYSSMMTMKKSLESKYQTSQEESTAEDDEFGNPETFGGGGEEEENIDPLFRVDLDKLTKGKDELFFSMARFAIQCHRMILFFVYTMPIENLKAALAIPRRFLMTPPFLFLLALIIRQIVSGMLLRGASLLPDHAEDDIRRTKDSKKGKSLTDIDNIMSMVKQAVMGFVNSTFPTAVSLFHMWVHVRADMYMLLCGVMVGLALSTGGSGVTTTTKGLSDEL